MHTFFEFGGMMWFGKTNHIIPPFLVYEWFLAFQAGQGNAFDKSPLSHEEQENDR